MITPSAISPTSRRLLGGADPEADRDRDLGIGLGRRDQLGRARRAARPAPRSSRPWRRRRRSRGRRRRSAPGARPASSAPPAAPAPAPRRRTPSRISSASPSGRSGTIAPAAPGRDRQPRELPGPAVREDHVRVDHQHHRDPLGDRAADLQRRRKRRPRLQRRRRRRVDRRPVGQRIGEGNAELDQVGAGIGVGLGDRQRRLPVGKAGHHVGHQGRPALVLGSVEGRRDPRSPGSGDLSHPVCATTSARSLSPRPERQRTSKPSPPRVLQQPGDRVRGLQRRDDPLQPRELAEGRQRLLVGDRDVAGAAGVAQVGVLGADARDSRARPRPSGPRGSAPPRRRSRRRASRAGRRCCRRPARRRGGRCRAPRRPPRRRSARPRRRR